MVIREVSAGEVELLPGLCALLQGRIDDGVSVGFLAPLSHTDASDYWRGILLSLGTHLKMLIAEYDAGVVGTVQLALSPRQNGKHRAEVRKLSVLGWHRVGEIPDYGARPDGELRPTAVYCKQLVDSR